MGQERRLGLLLGAAAVGVTLAFSFAVISPLLCSIFLVGDTDRPRPAGDPQLHALIHGGRRKGVCAPRTGAVPPPLTW
eukprot:2446473-Rhodomonas_salina.1